MQIERHAAAALPQLGAQERSDHYEKGPCARSLTLAALLLLWNLSVPEPMEQMLLEGPLQAEQQALPPPSGPARLPPLHDNGWSSDR